MPPKRRNNDRDKPIQDNPTGVESTTDQLAPEKTNMRGQTDAEFEGEHLELTRHHMEQLRSDPATEGWSDEQFQKAAEFRARTQQHRSNAEAFFGADRLPTQAGRDAVVRTGEKTIFEPATGVLPGVGESAASTQRPPSQRRDPNSPIQPRLDRGDLGLDQPESAQLGQRMGRGGSDSNEGMPGTGMSAPGIDAQQNPFTGLGQAQPGTALTSESGNTVILMPDGEGGFTTHGGGTQQQQGSGFDIGDFVGQLDSGDSTSLLDQLRISLGNFSTEDGGIQIAAPTVGGIPVRFVEIPPFQTVTINGEEVSSGFTGIVQEVGPNQYVTSAEATMAWEQSQLDQQIFSRLLTEVGDLESAAAQRRLDVQLALLRPELELRNTLAAQLSQANLTSQLNQQQFSQQVALQRDSQQFSREENALARRFDLGLQQLNQQFQSAQNALNRQMETAMFEAQNGIRLNDFAAAEAARERRMQIEDQQLRLQTFGSVMDFLAVLGQNPQIAGMLANNPQLGAMLSQFGIDAEGIFGAGSIPAGQLPNAQQFTALPPAAQENLLNALAGQFGMTPEVIRAEIMQAAPGGTRRAERAS